MVNDVQGLPEVEGSVVWDCEGGMSPDRAKSWSPPSFQ
jgi:hypothetical protein